MLETLESNEAYEALFLIGAQIQAQEASLPKVLELIVEKAAGLLDADLGWLALVDGTGDTVQVAATFGARNQAFKTMIMPVGRGVGGAALDQQETVIVADYTTYFQEDAPPAVRSAVTEEGLRSIICAPMLRDGRMVGALYVGCRKIVEFERRHASLVTALASQASIAIDNSRLFDQLETKNRLLERSEEIHRQLTDASLLETGLDGVATTLAGLLGRPIVVEQDVVPPFSRPYGSEPDPASEAVAATLPILAGDEELGRVVVHGDGPLNDLGVRAIEHGAIVLAVELLKSRTGQEVEWRLGGELLDELLEQSGPVDRRLAERAARLGLDTRAEHRIIVLECDAEVDQRAVRMAASDALVPGQRPVLLTSFGPGRIVLAVPAPLESALEAVLARLVAAARGDGRCSVGLSRSTTDLPRALRESLACARFAALSGRTDVIVRADDLGAMRFLFALDDPAPLQDYVDEQLGPLLADPRTADGQLVETLRAFLESDGHHAAIAERCHIHKSTVKYRLGRIGGILDRGLNDPNVRFELRLAVALADVLTALAVAPPLEERAATASS